MEFWFPQVILNNVVIYDYDPIIFLYLFYIFSNKV